MIGIFSEGAKDREKERGKRERKSREALRGYISKLVNRGRAYTSGRIDPTAAL